jgi:hypothetical protein
MLGTASGAQASQEYCTVSTNNGIATGWCPTSTTGLYRVHVYVSTPTGELIERVSDWAVGGQPTTVSYPPLVTRRAIEYLSGGLSGIRRINDVPALPVLDLSEPGDDAPLPAEPPIHEPPIHEPPPDPVAYALS